MKQVGNQGNSAKKMNVVNYIDFVIVYWSHKPLLTTVVSCKITYPCRSYPEKNAPAAKQTTMPRCPGNPGSSDCPVWPTSSAGTAARTFIFWQELPCCTNGAPVNGYSRPIPCWFALAIQTQNFPESRISAPRGSALVAWLMRGHFSMSALPLIYSTAHRAPF